MHGDVTRYMSGDVAQYEGSRWKFCNRCYELKPVAEFHRNDDVPDGYNPSCKDCVRYES